MTKRTGFVPAIIIIIAAIMVGAGIGGYFIWNKELFRNIFRSLNLIMEYTYF